MLRAESFNHLPRLSPLFDEKAYSIYIIRIMKCQIRWLLVGRTLRF